jgi:hypothetical protein
VLPDLRQALATSASAEARKRIQSMIQSLERFQTLSPKRVTIKMKNRPASDILREIARQTGYSMQYQGGGNGQLITMEQENATFWEATDFLCNAAGLTMYQNDAQMVFNQYENYWPYVCYQGPFKIIANNFNYNKTVNFGPIQRTPNQHQFRSETHSFSFQLHSEPKLPIMSIGQPKLLEAVDDLGNSMKNESTIHEVGYASHNGYRSYQHGSQINLLWPNKEARIVKRLRCSIPVTLLGEQKPEVVVDDILKVKNKKFVGNTVEIQIDHAAERNNKTQYEVKMSVRNNSANTAQDYTWTNSVHQRVELLDAKGNKYASHGYNWENSSPNHVQATFMFGNNGNGTLGPPVRLVYNHWTVLQHQIEFEFKNLALP